ncbi:unnamed protein product [Zymoseptoria tritici ST99CH_1E4]|uniref:Sister chromatid cohesion protein Dcc1 n=1 Tax=Zymoseptoria tritici ST99CH_1E4 TaxID=1276532 RepID=A0A2H1GXZ0_ZYMTR|nr:unnamed protein product [Zymoseptoria tritici ST99CH_1E4]
MSTQDPNAGVPIQVRPESQLEHYRLLELPADLLALLTSDEPPVLHLKSREDADGTAKDANAVLCTSDKTYDIRQVSHSNTVYLTRPHELPVDNGGPPRAGIEAIAKCESTIELLPSATQSAAPYIKAALPVFSSTGNYSSQKNISKAELFSHIPLSEVECEIGWSELACFESTNPPGSFVPSGKVKAQIWDAAFTVAVAERTDLALPFSASDIPNYATELTQEWPSELVAAVFAGVSKPSSEGTLVVDKEKCIRFVGIAHLSAKSEGRPTDTKAFLKAWKDAVPEEWRPDCQLSVLKGSYTTQDAGSTITYTTSTIDAKGAIANTADEAKSSLGAKRKWHEKFRASKKS